jgi:hypothetical protein
MGCWSIVDRSLLSFTAFFSSIFCVGIRDFKEKLEILNPCPPPHPQKENFSQDYVDRTNCYKVFTKCFLLGCENLPQETVVGNLGCILKLFLK